MARMAKMETCPTCGATLAANLVKRLRESAEGYICPGTSTKQESRKEFEAKWAADLEPAKADA